jgi:hypothetical protein
MEFIIAHKAEILGVLWGLSEALSFIPAVKANGVFQMVVGLIKKIAGK